MIRNETKPGFAGVLSVVLLFAALARGAHDLWAATLVHAALLGWTSAYIIRSYLRRSDTAVRLPLILPAACLWAALLLSSIFAANRFDAMFAVKDWTAAILMFFASANAFQGDEDTDLLLMIVIPGLWIQAGMALSQLISNGLQGDFQAQGTLVNPNIQAAFALFWVPPLGARLAVARRAGQRWGYWASGLAASVSSILMAGSAWAILCLALAGVAWMAKTSARPARVWTATGVVAALAVAILWYKFTTVQPGNSVTPAAIATDRLDWWASALRMFATQPWVGIGPGGFPSAYPAFKQGTSQSTLFAHSLPLTILAETGLAGFIAAAVFLGSWVRRAIPAFPARAPFAAGAVLFLISSLVNIGPEYLVNQLTLSLFLGICVAGVPARLWRPRLSAAVLASGLAVLALPLLAAPFLASRLIVDGRELLVSGDFQGARRRFDAAAELDSTAWEAFQGRALSRWAGGAAPDDERRQAVDDITRAIERNRLNGSLWWEKGLMLRDSGRIEEAKDALGRAVELRPGDSAAARDLEAIEKR